MVGSMSLVRQRHRGGRMMTRACTLECDAGNVLCCVLVVAAMMTRAGTLRCVARGELCCVLEVQIVLHCGTCCMHVTIKSQALGGLVPLAAVTATHG